MFINSRSQATRMEPGYTTESDWFESIGFEIVVAKTGLCRAMHEVGQQFIVNGYHTPQGLCIEAFHNMYPLLFAGRIGCDFTQLGSENEDMRIFNCPTGEVQFLIQRFYQCNNCGQRVNQEELKRQQREYDYFSVELLACEECMDKIVER